MMPTNSPFKITQNDLLPVLARTLKNADGTAIDLTTATAIVFSMRTADGATVKVSRQSATFVDRAAGDVSYTWQSGDTDTVGAYYGEFEVTFAGGPLTAPTRKIPISVVDDFA